MLRVPFLAECRWECCSSPAADTVTVMLPPLGPMRKLWASHKLRHNPRLGNSPTLCTPWSLTSLLLCHPCSWNVLAPGLSSWGPSCSLQPLVGSAHFSCCWTKAIRSCSDDNPSACVALVALLEHYTHPCSRVILGAICLWFLTCCGTSPVVSNPSQRKLWSEVSGEVICMESPWGPVKKGDSRWWQESEVGSQPKTPTIRVLQRCWDTLETCVFFFNVDALGQLLRQTAKVIWPNALSELSNKHEGLTWWVVRRTLYVRSSIGSLLGTGVSTLLPAALVQPSSIQCLEYTFASV